MKWMAVLFLGCPLVMLAVKFVGMTGTGAPVGGHVLAGPRPTSNVSLEGMGAGVTGTDSRSSNLPIGGVGRTGPSRITVRSRNTIGIPLNTKTGSSPAKGTLPLGQTRNSNRPGRANSERVGVNSALSPGFAEPDVVPAVVSFQSSVSRQVAGDAAGTPPVSSSPRSADLPFSFSIPQASGHQDPQVDEAVYAAQKDFADTLSPIASSLGSQSPEYSEAWQAAQAQHDNALRLRLGSEAFFRLSAVAVQQRQAASEGKTID